jgi:hypothetical protein
MAMPAMHWSPLKTLWRGLPDTLESVTTDNGMVVAAWNNGVNSTNVWIAVRLSGGAWQPPTKIPATPGVFDLAKAGEGAWLVWQGFERVRVVHVTAHGVVGAAEPIGASSYLFPGSPLVAAGSNGAVAVTWETDQPHTSLAYLPAGGGPWTTPEQIPQPGEVDGLVVDAAGDAQVVLQTPNPDAQHLRLSYVSRSPDGTWGRRFTVASSASLPAVHGNAEGDLVVAWDVADGGGGVTLAARYKPADGNFRATHRLAQSLAGYVPVALGMARDGSAVAVYEVADTAARRIHFTRADSAGDWLAPKTLPMWGPIYAVSMNPIGGFAVTSWRGWLFPLQVTKCGTSDICTPPDTDGALGLLLRFPVMTYAPSGAVNLVWEVGCRGELCNPHRVVAQRGR